MTQTRRKFLSSAVRILGGGAIALAVPRAATFAAMQRTTYLERSVFAMGTTVSISAFGEGREHLLHATSVAFDELYRLERLFSVYRPDSDISRINRLAGRASVSVDPLTSELLRKAKTWHTRTEGAFDMTVERLMEWWGFRGGSPDDSDRPPLESVGDRYVVVSTDGTVCVEKSGVKVDTGGIAVGFTVDRMAEILRREGVTAAFINHSGDVYALGSPEDAEGWEVSIPHPVDGETNIASYVLKDRALSTSANSSHRRARYGSEAGHILDPRTGQSPRQLQSLTIIAPTSIEADALSTSAFVKGVEELGGTGCGYVALFRDGGVRELRSHTNTRH